MPFNNPSLETHREQERLAREYNILDFRSRLDQAKIMGNNSGELLQIEELIKQFEDGKISKETTSSEIHKIIYPKEGAIDQSGTNPNMGGH